MRLFGLVWRSPQLAARVLLVAVPVAVAPAAHAGYNVTTVIDPTGGNFINLLGINNSGTFAGFDNSGGFTLTLPNNFATENYPGAASTMVTGINTAGDTSGIYVDAGGTTHGFTNIGGAFTTVDRPGTVFNQLLGINNPHTTVGYDSATDPSGATGQVAYSEQGGAFTDINALLPANMNSQAVGINNAATPWIVGFYQPTSTTSLGFLDVGGTITTIDPFGSTFTQALGVNDKGEIVGFYTDAMGAQHGYVDDLLSSFDPVGSVSTTINGVNDLGQIVGFYTDGNDNVIGFVGTPVPEPQTWAMMLLGFAGLGFAGYRVSRKNGAAAVA